MRSKRTSRPLKSIFGAFRADQGELGNRKSGEGGLTAGSLEDDEAALEAVPK